ncbi:hypothetical protein NMY22_g11659 [Coprinellus aureogranulatus]|nr:hypothetical protein NMY22_g11659 [Coprinellus aureogranulatus]
MHDDNNLLFTQEAPIDCDEAQPLSAWRAAMENSPSPLPCDTPNMGKGQFLFGPVFSAAASAVIGEATVGWVKDTIKVERHAELEDENRSFEKARSLAFRIDICLDTFGIRMHCYFLPTSPTSVDRFPGSSTPLFILQTLPFVKSLRLYFTSSSPLTLRTDSLRFPGSRQYHLMTVTLTITVAKSVSPELQDQGRIERLPCHLGFESRLEGT